MTSDQRSDISNGIWLCQTHAKLIDDDESAFPVVRLQEWKNIAEHMAALEAYGFEVRRAKPYSDLEKKAPKLIAEMREDLRGAPLTRRFIVMREGMAFGTGGENIFQYSPERHAAIYSVMTIMQHASAIYRTSFDDPPQYNFTEEFVSYLLDE